MSLHFAKGIVRVVLLVYKLLQEVFVEHTRVDAHMRDFVLTGVIIYFLRVSLVGSPRDCLVLVELVFDKEEELLDFV